MEYYTTSVKSTVRNKNEDNFIALEKDDTYFFGVADGLGGLSFGEIASSIAINQFKTQRLQKPTIEPFFIQANKAIIKESEKFEKIMGSTLAACIINKKNHEIEIGHVGDSRVYLFNETIWRTKDHTLVQELVDMGIIDEEQAFDHPEKHRLNKALGTCDRITVDTYQTKFTQSTIVLSTDGLHDYVDDETIHDTIQQSSLKKAAESLIKQARNNGSTDDITIIIARQKT